MNLHTITDTVGVWLVAFGLKVLGAIALWLIGRWLIYFSVSLITRSLKKRSIETDHLLEKGAVLSCSNKRICGVGVIGG